MKKLFKKLYDTLSRGEDAVLVTIVASSGATPRGSGARMLVTGEGRVAGTIGGGSVEYEALKIAREVLDRKGSAREYFRLRKNDVADIGMICGGDVDVYFKYLSAEDKELTELMLDMFEKGEQSWLITEIGENNSGKLALYSEKRGLFDTGLGVGNASIPEEVLQNLGRKPAQTEAGGRVFYTETLVSAGNVYVFGGGHVAQELVPLLNRCDFRCIVVEDREDFLLPGLFENAADSLVPVKAMDDISNLTDRMTEDDYVVIMTRGHKDDLLVEKQVLKTKARYIGVIGSRQKVAAAAEKLKSEGFTDTDLYRITSPIGLEIGSETPAEIAVSIAAQLISVRADRYRQEKD